MQGTTNVVTSGTIVSNYWLTLYVVKETYDVTGDSTTKTVACTGETAPGASP